MKISDYADSNQLSLYKKFPSTHYLSNPKNVLNKGYSIIYKDGKIVKNTKDISVSDELNVIISDGNIDVTVKGVNK